MLDGIHHGLHQVPDLRHELFARELAALDELELVLPFAGELGRTELHDVQRVQREHQRERLRRGHQLAALAMHVVLADQALDGRRARRGRAETLGGHRFAQLVVFDQLARALHRREQRRLGIARRRLGLVGVRGDLAHRDFLVLRNRRQVLVLLAAGAAVDREPARCLQHLAVGPEMISGGIRGDLRDARGLQVLGCRIEHREKAPHHHVVELLLGLVQVLGRLLRRNDGEVIRDLAVVEDALVRLHPALLEDLLCKRRELARVAQLLEGLFHRADVVLGQRARVGPGIGQDLVALVERLGERQRHARREAEAGVGFALQAGQVIEQRRELRRGLGFLRRDAGLAAAGSHDRLGFARAPQAFGLALGVVILLELGIEPSRRDIRPPWRRSVPAPPSSRAP